MEKVKFRKDWHEPRYYSESFKKSVIEEYLRTGISKSKISYKYGIKGNSTISKWMHKLGYSGSQEKCAFLEINPVELGKKDTAIESATTKAMAAEIKRLKQQLEDERLRTEMLNRMVDLAEKTYKITVRKNYNTK